MLGIFNMNAADSEAEKKVQQNAARYGLQVDSPSAAIGTGWKAGIEQKDYDQAISDINDGLAKENAHFRVKEEGMPKQNGASVSVSRLNDNLAKERANFRVSVLPAPQ